MTLIVIRGTLLRPLEVITSRFAMLATGDQSGEIPEPEMLCDELNGLAQQYEELRTASKNEKET